MDTTIKFLRESLLEVGHSLFSSKTLSISRSYTILEKTLFVHINGIEKLIDQSTYYISLSIREIMSK